MCSTNFSLRRFSWISHPHESFTDIMLLNHTWLHTHLITLIWFEVNVLLVFSLFENMDLDGRVLDLHLRAVLVNLSCENNHLTIMFALKCSQYFYSAILKYTILRVCVWCATFAQHITTPTNNSISTKSMNWWWIVSFPYWEEVGLRDQVTF